MLRPVVFLAALLSGGWAAACEVDLSSKDLDRLVAVGLGAEYGGSNGIIVKWSGPVRISLAGKPSAPDKAALDQVVAELGELIAPTSISVVTANENVVVHFAPEAEFDTILPQYEPVNMGYFWTWWDAQPSIAKAEVLISTTGLTQRERNHLIREEVTQMLGLMRDVDDDPKSIFYAAWTDTNSYTESDRQLVRALYCADVRSGMDQNELREALAD